MNSESSAFIEIRGAREHNLKGINLKIPRNKLVVITGLSGSGKSSLAFDTIYAEGQRRYLESLSSYARQFLEKFKKPEIDFISGLSPSIAIEQRAITHNPRSTVATVTEIYDYLRLLFAKAGTVHCHQCGKALQATTRDKIVEEALAAFHGRDVQILAPMVRGRKGEFQKLFQEILKKGYSKARIDGKMVRLQPTLKLRKNFRHDIEVAVDHIVLEPGKQNQFRTSVAAALDLSGGYVMVLPDADGASKKVPVFYSTANSCADCQISFPEMTPNMFSFNSPYGACPVCKGIGKLSQIEAGGVIQDPSKPLMSGGLNPEIFFSFNKYFIEDHLYDLAKKYQFEWKEPYESWPEPAREAFFWGDNDLSGLIEELEELFHQTQSEEVRRKVRKFLKEDICRECQGARLKKESLGVRIKGKSIVEVTGQSIDAAQKYFESLEMPESRAAITEPILKEIRTRIHFLMNVGLDYLTLDRAVATLAGGELQRIRLAAQIGVGLTGVLYVLDEPSIGLHPRDNKKLLDTLEKLRSMKNSVLVVEHDEETMRRADYLIDIGPGAGVHGGQIVACGTPEEVMKRSESLTARYLTGKEVIPVPDRRKEAGKGPFLELKGCREHNLKNINIKIPLGRLVCVTGVSGSGKSTLVHDILYKAMHNHFWKTDYRVGAYKSLAGLEHLDKVIEIDQSPIGRTPRSNPATYTDLFTMIRKIYSETQEAKVRNYSLSRFSFNVKGGRCESCRGEGYEKLQMSFMSDIYVLCETCKGRRYNDPTLDVRYRGKNISEVLDLSVDEAIDFFSRFSWLQEKLLLLQAIGLGYIKLGQPSTTLSGGEAQRIKIATELSKKSTGKTFYILDEPTTGLHFADIDHLMKALFRLRDEGNTILIIEHNLDVIKMADYVIDLGPEGGPQGGSVLGSGSPEDIAALERSHTGKFLRPLLKLKTV